VNFLFWLPLMSSSWWSIIHKT